jgi:hypothetical protein
VASKRGEGIGRSISLKPRTSSSRLARSGSTCLATDSAVCAKTKSLLVFCVSSPRAIISAPLNRVLPIIQELFDRARRSKQSDPTEEGLWIIPAFHEAPAEPAAITATTTASGVTGPTSTISGNASGLATSTTNGEHEAGTIQPLARQIRIQGSVPLGSWAEIFRCFVNPAARMNLKRLNLGIRFEMEAGPDAPLSPDHPAIKAMQEAARQLGLSLDVDE